MIGHFFRQIMSTSNVSARDFLDNLKLGWGSQYDPTLEILGLNDLDDAQGLTEDHLKDILSSPLRAVGAPPIHVARIITKVYAVNQTGCNVVSLCDKSMLQQSIVSKSEPGNYLSTSLPYSISQYHFTLYLSPLLPPINF
jgi:hypothetical protein